MKVQKSTLPVLVLVYTPLVVAGKNSFLSTLSSKDIKFRDDKRCDSIQFDPMPSLFGAGESRYEKYARCLAATEGLRKMRDDRLNANSRQRRKTASKKEIEEEEQRISTDYSINSAKVLESFGMTVKQFNELGKQVGKNSELKEKVLEQAYLYRMTFMLDDRLDRIPSIEDPSSKNTLKKSTKKKREKMFCQSIQEIEQLQSNQMDKLKRSLRVQKLPEGISLSDPNVLPFLSAKVRAVVEAFPLQAEQIVKKYGLNSDQFNDMYSKMKGDPFFRLRINKYMKEGDEKDDCKDDETDD